MALYKHATAPTHFVASSAASETAKREQDHPSQQDVQLGTQGRVPIDRRGLQGRTDTVATRNPLCRVRRESPHRRRRTHRRHDEVTQPLQGRLWQICRRDTISMRQTDIIHVSVPCGGTISRGDAPHEVVGRWCIAPAATTSSATAAVGSTAPHRDVTTTSALTTAATTSTA